MPWLIGLNPLSVENELRDGALAGVGDDLFGGARGFLDVDLGVGDGMLGEKLLGRAAVAAPAGGINQEFHKDIVSDWAGARRLATIGRL